MFLSIGAVPEAVPKANFEAVTEAVSKTPFKALTGALRLTEAHHAARPRTVGAGRDPL